MVAQKFDEIQKCDVGDERVLVLAREIQKALSMHLAIEEKLFYDRIRASVEEDDERVDMFEAYTEHEGAKFLLEAIESQRKNDERFKAELQVLGEQVKHHVKEEESTVFALAREVFEDDDLERIGEEWERAKKRSEAGASRNGSRNGTRKRTPSRSRR
jgi:hemerythrin-like domain-containing protein